MDHIIWHNDMCGGVQVFKHSLFGISPNLNQIVLACGLNASFVNNRVERVSVLWD